MLLMQSVPRSVWKHLLAAWRAPTKKSLFTKPPSPPNCHFSSLHRCPFPTPLPVNTSLLLSSPFCHCLSFHSPSGDQMELQEVLVVLEELAPLTLAEPWDNVGLLVEPSKPRTIKTILLTNDLTEVVMAEAEGMACDLIVSYHPPLFRPIKRLLQKDWKQRLAVRALEGGMAIFSPHTAWDSVRGGVNDWLVAALGSGKVSVLKPAISSAPHTQRLDLVIRNSAELQSIIKELECIGASHTHSASRSECGALQVILICSETVLPSVVQTLLRHSASQILSIQKTQQPPLPGHGQGRLSILEQPITLTTAVEKLKSHLGLCHLRLALGMGKTLDSQVCTVAVCAGSGASVLAGATADLYITGEMSHHEVLDAVAMGTSVLLSDHSNSERGFLAVIRERLSVHLPDSVSVVLSQTDRDPLQVV